jgi:hypothetical protein
MRRKCDGRPGWARSVAATELVRCLQRDEPEAA